MIEFVERMGLGAEGHPPPLRRVAILAAFLTSAACSSAQTIQTRPIQKEFTLRMYAPFLEPGLGGGPAKAGDEIAFSGPIEWTSPTEGKVPATLWFKKVVVSFRTQADRRTVAEAAVDLGQNGLAVWRHRHSYMQNGAGFAWNTIGDHRAALDNATAQEYDRFLEGVALLWAKRGVAALLATPAGAEALVDNGTLAAPIRVSYDKNGVVGKNPGGFALRLWHMPVNIRFTVIKHEPSHLDPWIIQLHGPIDIIFEAKEWRRRHGYARGASGFTLDPDFPGPRPDMTLLGPKLEVLMDRAVEYWSQAAAYLALDPLDRDLKAAITEIGGSILVPEHAPEPAVLRSLRTLESTEGW